MKWTNKKKKNKCGWMTKWMVCMSNCCYLNKTLVNVVVNRYNIYNAKLFFLFYITKSLHFGKCRIILLKSMISAHFNNTIITDSFCTMNTTDQIQTKIPTVIRSTTVLFIKQSIS